MNRERDDLAYIVVTNDEDQFSIWPAYREVPRGWQVRSCSVNKQTCLDYIRTHWKDMNPRSLREKLNPPDTD